MEHDDTTFVLSEGDFDRWRRTIPPVDWDAFVSLHHGKEPHARFVCALDMLVNIQRRETVIGTIIEAFCLATGAHRDETKTARDAKESFDLDPVRFLWDRIERNRQRAVKTRIENLVGSIIEERLVAHRSAPDHKDPILKDALSFVKMIREEEKAEREALLERGIERLRGDAEAQRKAFTAPTDDQLSTYLRTMVEKLGPNRFAGILEKALPSLPKP